MGGWVIRVDGWMDGWMGGTGGWVDRWIDGWMDGCRVGMDPSVCEYGIVCVSARTAIHYKREKRLLIMKWSGRKADE